MNVAVAVSAFVAGVVAGRCVRGVGARVVDVLDWLVDVVDGVVPPAADAMWRSVDRHPANVPERCG